MELPSYVKNWKDAIERGETPEQIAETCYHPDALLKGTVWGRVIRGHADITSYFGHFTSGKNSPVVEFHTLQTSPSGSISGEYTFEWIDDDDNAQSAPCNYTFESVEGENGETVISLHHSSFQPV